MKIRTKLLVSNKEQTKIQVLFSPTQPSPIPHTNNKGTQLQPNVSCSAQSWDPSSTAGSLGPVGHSGRMLSALVGLCTAGGVGRDEVFTQSSWGSSSAHQHFPSASPLGRGSCETGLYSVVGCKLSFSSRFSVPLSSSSISPSSPLNLSWAHLGLVLDFRNMNLPRPRGKAPRPRPLLTHFSLPSPSRSSCK